MLPLKGDAVKGFWRGIAKLLVTLYTARMSGEELADELKRLGMTPAEFALELGFSRHAVYHWLNARRPVPVWVPLAIRGLEQDSYWQKRRERGQDEER